MSTAAPRKIVYRTSGRGQGPITRLMSPSDFGELVKPFVFLDHFTFEPGPRQQMERMWHPHSGIATVTVMLDGGLRFAETTGSKGALPNGGVEFMRASGGVWHTGEADTGTVRGFQLWIALPPELENAHHASRYVLPEEVPADGPVRVILGAHTGEKSPIAAPPMTYLQVNLKDGERWTYVPAPGHDVAWAAVSTGALRAPEPIRAGEMAVFEESNQAIDLVAGAPTRFVIGSAQKHPHELWLGNYSVHTSGQALARGEAEIRRIGRELLTGGVL